MRNTRWHFVSLGVLIGSIAIATIFSVIFSERVTAQTASSTTTQSSSVSSAAPQILRAWPESGGKGQYVTLDGAGFGVGAGQVWFGRTGERLAANVSFPRECEGGFWRNRYVVVKVPEGVRTGQYKVTIVRPDGKTSNEANFLVTNALPTPGICAVKPDNGAVGGPVNIYGEGFGATAGRVTIGNADATVAPNGWSEGFISLVTPLSGMDTGRLRVVTATRSLSNPALFTAGRCLPGTCVQGETCCQDGSCRLSGSCKDREALCRYSWNFTTEKLAVVGAACKTGTECRSLVCGGDKKCQRGLRAINEQCFFDEQCHTSLLCKKGVCLPKYRSIGESCTTATECSSNRCVAGACQAGAAPIGAVCILGDQCQTATCTNGKCSQTQRPVSVSSITPQGGKISRNVLPEVRFNQLVDTESAKKNLSIQPPVSGTWRFYDAGSGDSAYTVAQFVPTSGSLAANTEYKVSVGNGVTARSGDVASGGSSSSSSGSSETCDARGETCAGRGAICTNGATCTGSDARCSGTGTSCSGNNALCTLGATCTGREAVCSDALTRCTGAESQCLAGATCPAGATPPQTCTRSGQSCTEADAVCSGTGVICSGSGATCFLGATCTGSSATCFDQGTRCTQADSQCYVTAQCGAATPPTSGGSGLSCNQSGQICASPGASCTGGAMCTGNDAKCSGVGTVCTGINTECTEGALCRGDHPRCSGVGTVCEGDGAVCRSGASCTGGSNICLDRGTQCLVGDSRCLNGASCPDGGVSGGASQSCTQKGQVCVAKGAECSGGATCVGDTSICRGVGTRCTGADSVCIEGATCTGAGGTCINRGSVCESRDSKCYDNAQCTGTASPVGSDDSTGVKKGLGESCVSNLSCISNICENAQCKAVQPTTNKKSIGEACAASLDCRSNNCSAAVCVLGAGGEGSACTYNEQCVSNECNSNNRCAPVANQGDEGGFGVGDGADQAITIKLFIDGSSEESTRLDTFTAKDQVREYRIAAVNEQGQPVAAEVVWNDPPVGDFVTVETVSGNPLLRKIKAVKQGKGVFTVKVKRNTSDQNPLIKSVALVVDFCDAPLSYRSLEYGFEWSYCQKRGSDEKPTLIMEPSPVTRGSINELVFRFSQLGVNAPRVDELIVVRPIENAGGFAPILWYNKTSGGEGRTGTVQPVLLPNGALAVRDENGGYYISTVTNSGKQYILFITKSVGARAGVTEVFDELMNSFEIAPHLVDATSLTKLKRDIRRIADINDIAFFIEKRCQNVTNVAECIPRLAVGSYLQYQSLSEWPSWQSALGNALGAALPKDPLSATTSLCANMSPYNAKTCWDEVSRKFKYGADVIGAIKNAAVPFYAYAYRSLTDTTYQACARLENPSSFGWSAVEYCKP